MAITVNVEGGVCRGWFIEHAVEAENHRQGANHIEKRHSVSAKLR